MKRPDSSEVAFDGQHVRIVVEHWDGRAREIVETPDAVAIVAVDAEGCLALVRQLREATGRELLELPAGGMEPGESALDCAKRELAEETGLTGGTWVHRGGFFTTPGFCRERMELYFATDLKQGEAAPVGDEQFEHVRVPVAEVPSILDEIEDAKTLVGLLLYLKDASALA